MRLTYAGSDERNSRPGRSLSAYLSGFLIYDQRPDCVHKKTLAPPLQSKQPQARLTIAHGLCMSPPPSINPDDEIPLLSALQLPTTSNKQYCKIFSITANMFATIRRGPSLFRSRTRHLKPAQNVRLPRLGEDGDAQYYLPDDLEKRWNDALIRAPEDCGITEINFSQCLERRWEEACLRSPVC